MLVLSRKSREAIQIGDDVTITILRLKGNSVRIGIEAPREVRVVRSELSTESEKVRPAATSNRYHSPNERAKKQTGIGYRSSCAQPNTDDSQWPNSECKASGPAEENIPRAADNSQLPLHILLARRQRRRLRSALLVQ